MSQKQKTSRLRETAKSTGDITLGVWIVIQLTHVVYFSVTQECEKSQHLPVGCMDGKTDNQDPENRDNTTGNQTRD